jgi:hypothetical protein
LTAIPSGTADKYATHGRPNATRADRAADGKATIPNVSATAIRRASLGALRGDGKYGGDRCRSPLSTGIVTRLLTACDLSQL